MTTVTNNITTSKIIRIQKEEKKLLAQLREVYGNDYKKYFEYIRRGTNIPLSLRKVYRLLDERKAYRRISDYFHRERIAKKTKRARRNALEKPDHRSSTRRSVHLLSSLSEIPIDQEMDDEDEHVQQQSTRSIMTNNSEEFSEENHRIDDDDDAQDIQLISSIDFTQPQKRRLSLTNNREAEICSSQANLLSIRESIKKALRELDHAIVLKTESRSEEHGNEQQRSSVFKVNEQSYTKLDDLVRSLSTVVNQQQDNVRLIINESSVLLLDDPNLSGKPSSTAHKSIQQTLQRLNTLVDRGHTVYDRIESILSEF